MSHRIPTIALLLSLLFFFSSAKEERGFPFFPGMNKASEEKAVTFKMIPEDLEIEAGNSFFVILELQLQPGWYTFWKNGGEKEGSPPIQIAWTLPSGFRIKSVRWPYPTKLPFDTGVEYGYEKKALFMVEITPPTWLKGTNVDIIADIRWHARSHSLRLSGESVVPLRIAVGRQKRDSAQEELFDSARKMLPQECKDITVKSRQGYIQVEVPCRENVPLTGIQFFPEHPKVVDDVEKILVKPFRWKSKGNNSYRFKIKQHDELQRDRLVGVALIRTAESTHAFEINSPIEIDPIELLGPGVSASVQQLLFRFSIDYKSALLIAYIAGIVLSFMPSFLSVALFKASTFIRYAGDRHLPHVSHGFLFSLGIVILFWMFALGVLFVQHLIGYLEWRIRFDNAWFLVLCSTALFIVSLNFFGTFTTGWATNPTMTGLGRQALELPLNASSSVYSGMLSASSAIPFMGPFLIPAIAYSMLCTPLQAWQIFTAMGAGAALFPFLFSSFPSFLKMMPTPGNWILLFMECIGFVITAITLWLLWVFSLSMSHTSLFTLLSALCLIAVALRVYGNKSLFSPTYFSALLCYGSICAAAAAGITLLVVAASAPPVQIIPAIATP